MTNQEKIELIEDLLEVDEGSLTEDTLLKGLEEWDSIAALTLIAMLDEKFNRIVSGDEVKALTTVRDILDYMQ